MQRSGWKLIDFNTLYSIINLYCLFGADMWRPWSPPVFIFHQRLPTQKSEMILPQWQRRNGNKSEHYFLLMAVFSCEELCHIFCEDSSLETVVCLQKTHSHSPVYEYNESYGCTSAGVIYLLSCPRGLRCSGKTSRPVGARTVPQSSETHKCK